METIHKMLSLVVMAAMVLSLSAVVSVAAPQDEGNAMAEETVEEVATMDTPEGVQVRLLQLEKSITRNIRAGEKAVQQVVTDEPEANVSEMNRILAELEVIKEQVSTRAQDPGQYENASQMATEFVTVKAEARNLSSEFREMAQERLSQDEREQISEEVREQVENESDEQGELDEQIQKRVREHNAEKVQQVLSNMGVQNETLVQKVRSGELNVGEAVSQVAREYRGLGKEKREQARGRLKEGKAQKEVQAQAAVEEAKKGLGQRMRNRAEHREKEVKQRLDQVRERIRSKLPDHVKDKVGGSMGPPPKVRGGQHPMNETGQGSGADEETNATAGDDEQGPSGGNETTPDEDTGDNTSAASGGMPQ